MTYRLVVVQDTVLKTVPRPSTELPDSDKHSVRSGVELPLTQEPLLSAGTGHLQVHLQPGALPGVTRQDWYAFAQHVQVEGTDVHNNPRDREPLVRLVDGRQIRLTQAIVAGGHFTWGEATRNGTRMPVSAEVVRHIQALAVVLEEVRRVLGNRPMVVTSWYRPPDVNRAVGGAPNSRHIVGDAVDFYVPGLHPRDIYHRLNGWWGTRGGLAYGNGFVHIDTRGYAARWRYPGVA